MKFDVKLFFMLYLYLIDTLVEPTIHTKSRYVSATLYNRPKIVEGDIVADRGFHRLIARSKKSRERRAVFGSRLRLWKDGLIPYVISPNVSKRFRKIIRRAFRQFTTQTCVHFIPKQKWHQDYIDFIQGAGCYSSVGRSKGSQVISLGLTCQTRDKAIHEIMHALGFFHEHSRPDRDNYVKILFWNIADGQEQNFSHYSHSRVDDLGEPYDYNSIMHYDNKAFSKNGRDTIQALREPDMRFGNKEHLSDADLRQIKKLYKCDRKRQRHHASETNDHCQDVIKGCPSYTEKSDSCEEMFKFMNTYCKESCGFCWKDN